MIDGLSRVSWSRMGWVVMSGRMPVVFLVMTPSNSFRVESGVGCWAGLGCAASVLGGERLIENQGLR